MTNYATYEPDLDLVSVVLAKSGSAFPSEIEAEESKPLPTLKKSRRKDKPERDALNGPPAVEPALDQATIATDDGMQFEEMPVDEMQADERTEADVRIEAQANAPKDARGTLWLYLQDVAKHRLLSAQEEIELGRRIQAGDHVAVRELASGNLRLVISIAKRYMRQGMDFEDLIQEGNVGLLQAVRRFNPSLGYRFSTYATWWIRQAITRGLSNKGRTIRLPVHVNEILYKLRREAKPYFQKLGRYPTIQELAQATGLNRDEIEHVLKSSMNMLSLDEFIGSEDDETMEKFIADKSLAKPDDQAEDALLRSKIQKLIASLSDEEQLVMKPLYGL